MTEMTTTRTYCPQCGSEMWPDHDTVNKVRVFVCTKPTCLYRTYPDYPRRAGNQEVCYLCGKIFTVRQDSAGVLCPHCKVSMQKNRNKPRNRTCSGRNITLAQQLLSA